MSESYNQTPNKGGEAELSEIIAWLRNELSRAEQMKREKILEAAKKLKELGFRRDWIASTIAEYADILGVSRSYIYDSLPDEFKSKRRSEAQKDAKKNASPLSDLESGKEPIIVGSDGHSFGDNLSDDDADGGAANSWREASTNRNETLDAWIPAVESIIQSAVLDGEYARVPKEVWDVFKKLAETLS